MTNKELFNDTLHRLDNSIEQIIIRVWKLCNFKCEFCNVSDNENNVRLKEKVEDMVRNFHYKFKYSNHSKKYFLVTISGGEPSILKEETIFILKYVKFFLEKKWIKPIFDIQTNASNIDLNFAKKLKNLWVVAWLVSFHTNEKNIFNDMLWVDYNIYFSKIINWIESLNNAWILVDINIVINKKNYLNFLENLKFLVKKFSYIDRYNIWFFQPHWEAEKNFEKLFISYKEVYEIYNEWISFLLNNWKKVISHMVWLPACYLSFPECSLEISKNVIFRKEFNLWNKTLISSINDSNKSYSKHCIDCVYNNVCSWVWNKFVWTQELKPVKYVKYFENNWSKNYLILNENNFLENNFLNEYNLWKRFVFFEINNFDELKVKKIKELLKIWFYKIWIYMNCKFDLKIIESGVTSIQVDIWNITKNDIIEIYKFSILNSPQFRINIDVFITSYSWLIDLCNYLEIVDYDFIRFFVLRPESESELSKYLDFIKNNNLIRHKGKIYTVWFLDELLYNS